MTESASNSKYTEQWSFSPWVNKAFLWLQGFLSITPWVILGIAVSSYLHHESGFHAVLVLLLFPLFVMLSVAIHEIGHFIGAKLGGMIPYQLQIGSFDIKMEMSGFRFRWCKPAFKVDGFILAFPNTDKPLRGQHLLMTLCGPLANLLAAWVFGIAAFLFEPHEIWWPLAGFALINLGMGLANLVPTEKVMASDGLQLIRWWRGMDENTPPFVLHKLNGLAVKGMTADKLPADQVALLQGMPFPMPLVHTWFVLKAHQNRADWAQAVSIEMVLEEKVAALTHEQLKAMQDLLDILHCEISFSKSLLENKTVDCVDSLVTKSIDWMAPCIRPRCNALQSALKGDAKAAMQWLAEAEKKSARSIDKALQISEEKLRRAIREKVTL